MYRLFKNKSKQVGVILPNAKRVEFLNYVYVTDREDEIAALDGYAKDKECGVYFDAEDTKVSEEQLTKIRAEMKPQRNESRNMVFSPGIGSSSSVTKTGFQQGVASTASMIRGNRVESVTVSGAGSEPKGVTVSGSKDQSVNTLRNKLAEKSNAESASKE